MYSDCNCLLGNTWLQSLCLTLRFINNTGLHFGLVAFNSKHLLFCSSPRATNVSRTLIPSWTAKSSVLLAGRFLSTAFSFSTTSGANEWM